MSKIYLVQNSFEEHLTLVKKCVKCLTEQINEACEIVDKALANGYKVLIFGNGGSAADAQHIAAEFTGRFVKERVGLPVIALTTDTSALTAIGNDYGFSYIFSRQIEAIANEGDVLIGISTSGNSQNVLNAFIAGNKIRTQNIGLSGNTGGKMSEILKNNIVVPSSTTARIQEIHILIGHIICQYIDSKYEDY
jgi:D-sedoheptulose 7-phosphate isomerase